MSPKKAARPDQRWCSKSCAQAWRNGARPPYERNVVVGMPRKLQLSRIRSQRHRETFDGVTDAEIFERDPLAVRDMREAHRQELQGAAPAIEEH